MAISFVNTATKVESTGVGSTIIDLSGMGLQENDIVVVSASTAGGNVDRNLSETGGTWTEVADLYANDTTDINLGVYIKRMSASPDSSVTIQVDAGTPQWSAIAKAWRGVDVTTAQDVAATTATGISSADANPPSIIPITNGAEVVAIGATSEQTGTITFPAGYGNTTDVAQTNCRTCMASKNLAVAASEDPGLFDCSAGSGADCWAGVTIALRPAPAAAVIGERGLHAIGEGIAGLQSGLHAIEQGIAA